MRNALQQELIKYMYKRLFWIFMVVWTIFLLWAYFDPFAHFRQLLEESKVSSPESASVYLSIAQRITNILSPNMAVSYSFAVWSAVGPHIAAIVGAYLGGSEYSWRTLPAMLIHTRRRDLIAAKLLLLLLYIFMMVLITLIVGLASSWYTTLNIQQLEPNFQAQVAASSLGQHLFQFLVAVLGPFFWGLFGFFGAMVTQSTLFGVFIGIGYPYFESFVIARYISDSSMYNWLPGIAQLSLMPAAFDYNIFEGVGVVGHPMLLRVLNVQWALVLVMIYLILMIIVGWKVFQYQEIR